MKKACAMMRTENSNNNNMDIDGQIGMTLRIPLWSEHDDMAKENCFPAVCILFSGIAIIGT